MTARAQIAAKKQEIADHDSLGGAVRRPGLPDEALLAFAGSGIETLWQLSLPAIANRQSLGDLSDLELTFDLRAQYSRQLRNVHLQSMPATVRRLTFFSGRAYAKTGFDA